MDKLSSVVVTGSTIVGTGKISVLSSRFFFGFGSGAVTGEKTRQRSVIEIEYAERCDTSFI
jgi:hypothetical protein